MIFCQLLHNLHCKLGPCIKTFVDLRSWCRKHVQEKPALACAASALFFSLFKFQPWFLAKADAENKRTNPASASEHFFRFCLCNICHCVLFMSVRGWNPKKISLLIWKMVGTLSSSWLVLCKSISCAQVNGVKIAGKHNENLSWHVETHIWETTLCQSAETEWASAFTSGKTVTKSRELVFYPNQKRQKLSLFYHSTTF